MRPSEREAWSLVQTHVSVGKTDSSSFYDRKRFAMLLSPVLEEVHRVVVEVGSGYGAAIRCVSRMGGVDTAVGIDADRTVLEASVLPGYRPTYVQANAERGFPFRTESVDCLIASEVYEHLYRPEEFLREAYRVLRPGRRLILTTPNTESLALMTLRRLPRAWARRIVTREGQLKRSLHPEFFGDLMAGSVHGHRIEGASLREMERMARRHGFRQIRSTTWGLPLSPGFGVLLPRRVTEFLMGHFHALAVGLRHILVVWQRDSVPPPRHGGPSLGGN